MRSNKNLEVLSLDSSGLLDKDLNKISKNFPPSLKSISLNKNIITN
jgi:hypothetical protein